MGRRALHLTSYAVALLVFALAEHALRAPTQTLLLPTRPSTPPPSTVVAPLFPPPPDNGADTSTTASSATAPGPAASPRVTPPPVSGRRPTPARGRPGRASHPPFTSGGGDQHGVTSAPPAAPAVETQFQAVVNGACANCRVTQSSNGTIEATVPGAGPGGDSAYALLDFGGSGGVTGPVYVQDRIGLGRGETPAADLQVLQVLDTSHRVVYRLVISAGSRMLRLQSPPGSLAADPIDVSTGAVVPNDGSSSVLARVGVQPEKLLDVSIDGKPVVHLTDLVGGEVGPQRYLAAGVVATATGSGSSGSGPVSVSHAQVVVTANPSGGQAPGTPSTTPSLAPSPPVTVVTPSAVTPPKITGTTVAGSTLTAGTGTWSDPAARLTIAWQRCGAVSSSCATIAGASGRTYTVTEHDLGATLRVSVTATNAAGSGTAVSALTAPVTMPLPGAPKVVSLPVVSGEATVGGTLTAESGTWNDASSFAYAWQRCASGGSCVRIEGADGPTYRLTADDLGATIEVVVTATGAGGSASATSTPTAVVAPAPLTNLSAPTISGDPTVGSTLTATSGDWSNPAAQIAYAWQSCDAGGTCTPIDGATGSTLTLTDDLAGRTVTVVVTATDASGSATATATPVTVNPAPAPSPAPQPSPPSPGPATPAPAPPAGAPASPAPPATATPPAAEAPSAGQDSGGTPSAAPPSASDN